MQERGAVGASGGERPVAQIVPRGRRRGILTGGLWLFAVFLPAAAIGIELVTGMCADAFFDPIPTWIHLALACLVPGANALVCRASTRGPRPGEASGASRFPGGPRARAATPPAHDSSPLTTSA
jgi:hypothetical protein